MDRLFPFYFEGHPSSTAELVKAVVIATVINGAILAFYTFCVSAVVWLVFL